MTKPEHDEFEISLFGPGVGESSVVHIGDGKWVVVDSCKENKASRPIALEYLQSIGVDAAHAVTAILISHWDADHVSGISEIATECKHAIVSLPSAYTHQDFTTYAYARHNYMAIDEDENTELFNLINALTERHPHPSTNVIPAQEGAIILEHTTKNGTPIRIMSHAPSNHIMAMFLDDISRIDITQPLSTPEIGRNQVSAVYTIQIGPESILLGGDLPHAEASTHGWRAILNINRYALPKSNIFKVPHHGSTSSYHPDIWNKLTNDNPIAILTPKLSCRNSPPTESGIAQIAKHTPSIYCTCQPKCHKPHKIQNNLEKVIQKAIVERRRITGKMGHICVRFPLTCKPSDAHVSLYNSACKL